MTTHAALPRPFDLAAFRRTLAKLIRPGVISTYDHFEIVEVVATPPHSPTRNVVSVVVACEANDAVQVGAPGTFLPLGVQIDGFKGWRFGLMHYRAPLTALDQALDGLSAGQWTLSGKPLAVGSLRPEVPTFAPCDGSIVVPLNGLLKNNFWSGSHVLRLLDPHKTAFKPFFEDRRRLQALSDSASRHFPLAFAGLSDFLGDIIIQLPVTLFVTGVRSQTSDVLISATWRPDLAARDLRVSARTRWDGLLVTADVSEPFQTNTTVSVDGQGHAIESEIWDDGSKLIVAATATTSTVKQVTVQQGILQHEPRVFVYLDEDDQPLDRRVGLTETSRFNVGFLPDDDAIAWCDRRQNIEEARRLAVSRDFKQFRPLPGGTDARKVALDDLRFLISRHGMYGVDLWDPYLTGDDLLQTLFWCPYASVALRALTDGRTPPGNKTFIGPIQPFADAQRSVLKLRGGNLERLKLEYRGRSGPEGWGFHDRFLIFPGGPNGPSAWSLGTSVNSVGKAHHILQKVSNPALVAGAFDDLWATLSKPDHLIWKAP